MGETIHCVCGYRGPSVPEGEFWVCPICQTRVSGAADGAARARPAARGRDDQRPEEPLIYRIPCPQGHVLKAREDMLGQKVCCPQCNAFFVLRAADSVEFRREQARRQVEAEEQAARAWLRRAVWAAVIIGGSFVVMLIIGLIKGAGRR